LQLFTKSHAGCDNGHSSIFCQGLHKHYDMLLLSLSIHFTHSCVYINYTPEVIYRLPAPWFELNQCKLRYLITKALGRTLCCEPHAKCFLFLQLTSRMECVTEVSSPWLLAVDLDTIPWRIHREANISKHWIITGLGNFPYKNKTGDDLIFAPWRILMKPKRLKAELLIMFTYLATFNLCFMKCLWPRLLPILS